MSIGDLERMAIQRIVDTVLGVDDERYRELTVQTLEALGLNVTAATLMDGKVLVEARGEDGLFLVASLRRDGDITAEEVMMHVRMATKLGRKPVLITPLELDEGVRGMLDDAGVTYSDRDKTVRLLRVFGIAKGLLEELDREVLMREGDRFLPSAGSFDDLMRESEDALADRRLSTALATVDRALEIKSSNHWAHQLRARVLMSMGMLDPALDAVSRAIDAHPKEHAHWFVKGSILHRMGLLQEEIDAYDRALMLKRGSRSALLNKGATLYQLRRFDEALACFDDVLRRWPEDVMGMNDKGLTLRAMDRLDEALSFFSRALLIDPSNVDAQVNRATLLTEMGRHDDAIDAWKDIVDIDRTRASSWIGLGEAQRAAGDPGARSSFEVAVDLDPTLSEGVSADVPAARGPGEGDYWHHATRAAALESFGRLEEALLEAEECVEIDWGNAFGHVRVANIRRKLGRGEEALAAARDGARAVPALTMDLEAVARSMGRERQALSMLSRNEGVPEARLRTAMHHLACGDLVTATKVARTSKSARMQHVLALSLVRQGEHVAAERLFRKLLRGAPDLPELLNGLAVCQRFNGDLEGAMESLSRCLDIAPEYSDAWNNMGCVLFAVEDFEGSIHCFSRSLLFEERPEPYLNLGMAEFMVDETGPARKAFTESLRLRVSPEALNLLGVVAVREGELVKALEFFDAAMELAPEFEDAVRNRDTIGSLIV